MRGVGFSNPLYAESVRSAGLFALGTGVVIRLITAPLFMATKIVAFRQGGMGDYLGSPDLEDIIAVVDGRTEIIEEVDATGEELRRFLASEFGRLLEERSFLEVFPGRLGPDEIAQSRTELVLDRLRCIAGTGR